MISVEVIEPSINYPYKTIFFTDSDDVIIRQIFYKNNILLLDIFSEYDSKKNEVTCVFFCGIDYSIISYREFLYDGKGNETGTIDYRNINGEIKKINYSENIYYENDKVRKVKWFNDKGEYCFYEIYILSGFVELDGIYIRDDNIYDTNDKIIENTPPNIEFFNDMDKILKNQEDKLTNL